jgi:hypothetical protein
MAMLLLALAITLGRALVTHDGVGPVEWLVGLALVASLGYGALHFARHTQRT